MASTLTDTQLAKLTRLSHMQSLAARVKVVTDDLQDQIDTLDGDVVKSVALAKDATAAAGYAASYTLTVNGTALGTKINIPKDFLVKSASMNDVVAADKASGGKFENDATFAVGDRYIDFVVNTAADGDNNTETDQHIYLNVKDLVDVYTAGNKQCGRT